MAAQGHSSELNPNHPCRFARSQEILYPIVGEKVQTNGRISFHAGEELFSTL